MTKPLDGLFVLEVANWIAAPCCGALMADMGADVVKIEPPEGDSMRYVQRQPRDTNGRNVPLGDEIDRSFTLDNRGKRSICVNLGTEEGRALVNRLALHAGRSTGWRGCRSF